MNVATDQAITKCSEDRFGRREFAARIAKVISSLKDTSSIVISVNAPWGEGKTSVLNMIEEKLDDSGDTLILRFNPWRFPDEERLLLNFFNTLAERLKIDLKEVSEKIGEGFKDFVHCLSNFQIAGFGIGGGVGEVLDKRLPDADIEEVKKRINAALMTSPKKIVVFMDDIDRLDKRDIQAVFRLVKLTADFPNTAYVLAFDDEMVSASLAEQFGGKEAGRSYLEKIVQVPLPVPPADPQILRKMVFEGVEAALKSVDVELTTEEARQFVAVFDKSFSRKLSSPRAVKRYTNMLNFALPILKDEVNMLDLVLIEGVRAFFPTLYETIRDEFGEFLSDSLEYLLSFNKSDVKIKFGNAVSKSLTGLTDAERDSAHFALQVLFPNIREYGINIAGAYITFNYDDWEKKKRICASRYFRRYFNYGIPPNDVSDKEVEKLINSLGDVSVEQLMNALEALCAGGRGDILVQKLRMYQEKVVPSYAGNLALAIARRSDLIRESHPDDNIFGLGSLAQSAFLLRELIGQIEDIGVREKTAKDVASDIERLPFAYEFCRKIKKLRKEQGSEEFVSVVSSQCEQEISRIFADKLALAAKSAPIEDSYPLLKRNFYIEWRLNAPETLREYIQQRLQEHPDDVTKFLSAFLGVSSNPDSGLFSFSIPQADIEYQCLTDIIHPDQVMEAIRLCYPEANAQDLPAATQWFVHSHERATLVNSTE